MKISILLPTSTNKEIQWAVDVVMKEFLGLDYTLSFSDQTNICIKIDEKSIIIFTSMLISEDQIHREIINIINKKTNNISADEINIQMPKQIKSLVVMAGNPSVNVGENEIFIGFDLFGSVYFMLSRHEEFILETRDEHGRFPGKESLSGKNGFLERPIVDEYVEFLWACFIHLAPTIKRKVKTGKITVSCDIDEPYTNWISSFQSTARHMIADVLKRNSLKDACQSFRQYYHWRRKEWQYDQYIKEIDWIMDVNEEVGNVVVFYFLVAGNHWLDGKYSLTEPAIANLIKRIVARGHEIGLHASYESYNNAEQIGLETNILKATLEKTGALQNPIGSRQHYLRWKTPETARYLDSAGISYDSTLGYADSPGFRCGTCKEFTMFDVEKRKPLAIRERPLIMMECSVLDSRYMSLGCSQEALDIMAEYKRKCMIYGGNYVLLWHNSHLTKIEEKELYKEIIK